MNIARFAPKVISLDNKTRGDRGTLRVRMANSASLYIGSFFDPFTGTNGAQTYTANQRVRGIVVDILTFSEGSYISVGDAVTTPGVVVNPTNTVPLRYTAPSDNVTRVNPDLVVFDQITSGDRIEAYLTTGTSGNLATRGTTAASGVLNNYLEPDVNFPYMLLETGANAAATGLNMQIVGLPVDSDNKILVKLINDDGANS